MAPSKRDPSPDHDLLMEAVRNRRKDEVITLIDEKGLSVNTQDDHGRTALSWLAGTFRGNPNVSLPKHPSWLDFFLERGADGELADDKGLTPLHWAVTAGLWMMVSAIVARGLSSPDVPDSNGRTPLSWAAEKADFSIAMTLIQHKARIDQQDCDGHIPLWWFATRNRDKGVGNGYRKLMGILGASSLADHKDKEGRTLLSWAAEHGKVKLASYLLSTGWVDPDLVDKERKTPMIWAMESRHLDLAVLLAVGVEVEGDGGVPRSTRRDTVSLHLMIEDGRSDMAKMFIENMGYDLDKEDDRGFTPLKLALDRKDHAVVETLLLKGAKIRGISSHNWFDSYRGQLGNVLKIVTEGTKTTVRLIPDDQVEHEVTDFRNNWTGPIYCMLFKSYHHWKSNLKVEDQVPNRLVYDWKNEDHVRRFTLSTWICSDQRNGENQGFRIPDRGRCRIEWTVTKRNRNTIHYSSTLSHGWVPADDLEFVELFMQKLREDWLCVCKGVEKHLSSLRSKQLELQGKDGQQINALARTAQHVTKLHNLLERQVVVARNFTELYRPYSATPKFKERLDGTIDELSKDIHGQLDRLDQSVRDILQIEFAWVSINEAQKSTSLATSMKRLSWITFIFLPLTFASSLFGMNVDVLQDNPPWPWYLLVGGASLLSTVTVWLMFKFTGIETWVERRTKALTQRRSVEDFLEEKGIPP